VTWVQKSPFPQIDDVLHVPEFPKRMLLKLKFTPDHGCGIVLCHERKGDRKDMTR